MISFFHRPFPYSENLRKKFLSSAGISLFVFLFLLVFKPFGMNHMEENQLPITAGYGAVTFIVAMLTNLIIPRLFPSIFNEDVWSVGKEIIYIQFVIFLIALGNLFFTVWLGFDRMSLRGLANFELITLAVAAIPITVMILVKQNVLLKRNLLAAQELSENLYHKERLLSKSGEQVTIYTQNPKDNFTIEIKDIYYITSADNYVEVFYFNSNNLVKKILRTTMRSVQGNLKLFSQFYRCHRAFIVNLEKVKKVTGNAQGYRLILEDTIEQIPVARSMNTEISQRLSR